MHCRNCVQDSAHYRPRLSLLAMVMVVIGLTLAVPGVFANPEVTSAVTKAALVIIDVQDCFLPGGSLSVNSGSDVIPVINRIREKYDDRFAAVALTKDWHCDRHVSFATSHSGSDIGDVIDLRYSDEGKLCLGGSVNATNFPEAIVCPEGSGKVMSQVLWPVHCVQGVGSGPTSSNLHQSLKRKSDDLIITKGTDCQVDSYSAFFDNGRYGKTALDTSLKARGVDTIFVTGLALDYCVKFTALDGKFLGYNVYVVRDAARGVAQSTVDQALQEFRSQGVELIESKYIGDILPATATWTHPNLWPVILAVMAGIGHWSV